MKKLRTLVINLALIFSLIFAVFACQRAPTVEPTVTAKPGPIDSNTLPTGEILPPTTTPLPVKQAVALSTSDGIELAGTLFGSGETAVLLAHQGTTGTDQTSWHTFGELLASHGFTALAFDFRGVGSSGGWLDYSELDLDVLAALQYLRDRGHQHIVCMGASMGGIACSRIAVDDQLAGLVTLGSTMLMGGGIDLGISREELGGLAIPKLFITSEHDDDTVIDHTTRMYELAAEPKELHLLAGSAHGTDIFLTESGEELTQILLDFTAKVAAQFAPTVPGVITARSLLTFDELMTGVGYGSPVDEAALSPPENAAPSPHTFEGRLELHGEEASGDMLVLKGDPDQEPEVAHLPEFDFEFVQSEDGYLVPVQRGLVIADHPYWNYILEPGRVWGEAGDQDYSRASFPFALVWKGSNATLNGTMTFLFTDTEISRVWYQVTQETTISLSADMWGALEATYHAYPLENGDQVREAFARELADHFPTKPVEQLSQDYPGVDVSAFGRGVSPGNMTWYGLVVNGVNYVDGCQTRYGSYPFCESMRASSYSTAKSAFVSVALMRLAQVYGAQVLDFLIMDYVPEYADSPGDWRAVTFDHVIDMATGNFESAGMMVDEEQWDNPFWSEEYYNDIIAAAFDWPHSASPGTQWVYRTSDTFILTRALQNYLVSVEGEQADIFDFVVDEIYRPLKMGPGVFSVLRTKDEDWQGQPYGGLGMWWIPDDLAKIGDFLNAKGGLIAGEQILHPDLLAAALQQDPGDRGVARGGYGKYNNAFWADRYAESNGFECDVWVPQMLGYSGIVVVLFPNGITYYYASDGRDFTWDAALREADKIIPLCP